MNLKMFFRLTMNVVQYSSLLDILIAIGIAYPVRFPLFSHEVRHNKMRRVSKYFKEAILIRRLAVFVKNANISWARNLNILFMMHKAIQDYFIVNNCLDVEFDILKKILFTFRLALLRAFSPTIKYSVEFRIICDRLLPLSFVRSGNFVEDRRLRNNIGNYARGWRELAQILNFSLNSSKDKDKVLDCNNLARKARRNLEYVDEHLESTIEEKRALWVLFENVRPKLYYLLKRLTMKHNFVSLLETTLGSAKFEFSSEISDINLLNIYEIAYERLNCKIIQDSSFNVVNWQPIPTSLTPIDQSNVAWPGVGETAIFEDDSDIVWPDGEIGGGEIQPEAADGGEIQSDPPLFEDDPDIVWPDGEIGGGEIQPEAADLDLETVEWPELSQEEFLFNFQM